MDSDLDNKILAWLLGAAIGGTAGAISGKSVLPLPIQEDDKDPAKKNRVLGGLTGALAGGAVGALGTGAYQMTRDLVKGSSMKAASTMTPQKKNQLSKLAMRVRVNSIVTKVAKKTAKPVKQADEIVDWLSANAPLFAGGAGALGVANQALNDVDDQGRKRPRARYLPWLALLAAGLGLGLNRKGKLPTGDDLSNAGNSLSEAGKSIGWGYTPFGSK